jgi:hypothetical protein
MKLDRTLEIDISEEHADDRNGSNIEHCFSVVDCLEEHEGDYINICLKKEYVILPRSLFSGDSISKLLD